MAKCLTGLLFVITVKVWQLGGCFPFPTGKPGCCAQVKTIKYPVKYKTTKKVCGYKWRLVDAGCGDCDGCDAFGCEADYDSGAGVEAADGDPFGDDVPPVPIPHDPNA